VGARPPVRPSVCQFVSVYTFKTYFTADPVLYKHSLYYTVVTELNTITEYKRK